MDKVALLAQIRAALEAELAAITASAADARSAATHEDAKPENQYDTRGLEASYLAGAQAGRAQDLAARIANLEFIQLKAYGDDDAVGLAALVEVDDGEQTRRYFVAPEGGGLELTSPEGPVRVLTPQAPLGGALMGKRVGDVAEVRLKGKVVELELLSLL
ncbi:MAG: GreA/GreB family elongation factor [Deltaproteobacteria bacterium]|nr:GreA/GreB family elongation factor [Deltaproteobacteria bacterium]